MRGFPFPSFISALALAIVVVTATAAEAQTLRRGLTREQCQSVGGVQWTVTSSLGVQPEVGDCVTGTPQGSWSGSGGTGGSGGNYSNPWRDGRALGVINNALGGMINVMMQRNYRLANDANLAGMQALANNNCDQAARYFDEAVGYLRENGDSANVAIVDRNRDQARECQQQLASIEQMQRDNERQRRDNEARQAAQERAAKDRQYRQALANPFDGQASSRRLLDQPDVKAEVRSACVQAASQSTAHLACTLQAETEAIMKRIPEARSRCGRLADQDRQSCAFSVHAEKYPSIRMGECVGDCSTNDQIRTDRSWQRNKQEIEANKPKVKNPFD